MTGSLEVICGSMFSGKTEELMRRLKRAQFAKQKIQVFKPIIDQRYSNDHIQSHDANKFPSILVSSANEILNHLEDNTRVVGIDEAQFFDAAIVEIAEKLAFRGVRVVAAGLDTDSRAKPFGPMPALIAMADTVTKLTAICVVCGDPAIRTQRITKDESGGTQQIFVGASDHYEPRCRFCHEPNNKQLNKPSSLTTSSGKSSNNTTANA